MKFIQLFAAYANDFEKTFVDDDWSRLERYFAEDAIYEVKNSPIACRLEGRAKIFAGIRKSLDGFDRCFAVRKLSVKGAPEELPNGLALHWQGTYEYEGLPPLEVAGRSEARYEGDRIVYLCDSYEDQVNETTAAWLLQYGTGLDLDMSYL